MKVPLSWLREYVDLSGLKVADLVERLTIAGLEVSSVRCIGVPTPEGLRAKAEDGGLVWARDKVVVGRVVKVEKHPNADKLKLVHAEYGAATPRVVVTGAPNVQVGDSGYKVILGLTGTVYWDGHVSPKKLSELKPTQLRGVPSDSMVMSEFELGISEEHEGVIILREDEAPDPGSPAVDLLGDVVLEIDVLPNMARCLSLIGVAREVSALFGRPLRLPNSSMEATGKPAAGRVQVAITDPTLSARYAAILLDEVTVGPAPAWMRRRLTYAGMRPISNVVDVTNYVMLEWGQPLHAFDLDKLRARVQGAAPTITVRPATPGEILTTLDGARRELTAEHLVIADTKGAIALAGVMGGAETEVSSTTKTILLESANFDFVSIRRTSRALELPSEASQRFSKGIHPETVRPAAERAADLMRLFGGATIAQGLVDTYPAPLPPQVIDLSMAEVQRRLGMNMSQDEAVSILRRLEFGVEEIDPSSMRVTTPTHRRDLQAGVADLLEELARIYGYDRLPATLLAEELPPQEANLSLEREERLKDILVGCGLQECITYSLTVPERDVTVGLAAGEYVRVINPATAERVVMRQSVLGGLLDVAVANLRHTENARLFEIGAVYLAQPGQKLPEEPRRLALVLTGRRDPEFWADGPGAKPQSVDFFDLKGILSAVASDLHLSGVTYRPLAEPARVPYLHPGLSAELCVQGKGLGYFGQLHPRYAASRGLDHRVLLACELDLDGLLGNIPDRHTYQPIPRFPAALRDIAIIVDATVPAETVNAEIRAGGGDLLKEIRLFDLYGGDSIPVGKKSLAYALSYLADDRTLTDKDVDKAHKKIEERLKQSLKAVIRGKE